jgi:(1->4)-alpha-D-glucan 1-alpha-D-glucosylmutase
VPDVYQGAETWNLSLVDPDNRRPVDYGKLRRMLAELPAEPTAAAAARALADAWPDGRVKLYATRACLRARKAEPSLFIEGAYEPIASDAVIAFERSLEDARLVVVAPRFSRTRAGGGHGFALGDAWENETLTLARAGRFVDVFTGQIHEAASVTTKSNVTREGGAGAELSVAKVLSSFPIAWLRAT